MATVQYLDIAGLQIYDGLIKNVISEGDAKSLKTVKLDGLKLNFYKSEKPANDAIPDFSITLPEQNTDDLLKKITDGVKDNVVIIGEDGIVVDSGIKSTDLALKDDVQISITTDTTTEGAAKSYTVKQGETQIAVIDIPKDMVVSNGTVETYTDETLPTDDGAPTKAGTYIVLTIANKASDKLYIPAETLVDVYKAQQDATQIQLTVSPDNTISAVIVAGSIGTIELADSAITTDKIADKNVTLDKLDESVQTSLGLADTALQPDDVTTIPKEDIEKLFSSDASDSSSDENTEEESPTE